MWGGWVGAAAGLHSLPHTLAAQPGSAERLQRGVGLLALGLGLLLTVQTEAYAVAARRDVLHTTYSKFSTAVYRALHCLHYMHVVRWLYMLYSLD